MTSYDDLTARFEFKRDPENDFLIGPDGGHYDSESEAMYFSLRASCGCGDPSGVHGFIIKCLRQFEGDAFSKPGVGGIKTAMLEHPDIAAEFIAHYLTGENLLEHGTSVHNSWLTRRGEQFLEVGPMRVEDDL